MTDRMADSTGRAVVAQDGRGVVAAYWQAVRQLPLRLTDIQYLDG
jgi:hypothetical protein